MATRELLRRPIAGAESVEDLVAKVLRGEVRIPVFQRGLKWDARNVVELFDSMYRGYPIGSLLLRVAPGHAGQFRIGPLTIAGEESDRALWVIDGQQRLSSLAVGLGRDAELPRTVPPADPFVVYFDPVDESFRAPRGDGALPSTWIPLPRLLDASDLSEWVFTSWKHAAEGSLRAVVFEAGKRLREYKVPLYVIETPDEEVARQIFDRVNSAGKPLDRTEVWNALFGHKSDAPSTLGELAADLASLGMGAPDEESQILPSMVALRGLDVTRPFGEHARERPEAFANVMAEAAPVLRKVMGFLRAHAEIPHLRLLPYSAPLVVLARFFALHPEPTDRTQRLLVRWIWRTFFSPALDDRTLRRHGVAAITADEEASAQALLGLVSHEAPARFEVPDRFDARSAASRFVLLGLASLQPREIANDRGQRGQLIDLSATITEVDKDAFRPIFAGPGEIRGVPANRVLTRGAGQALGELTAAFRELGPEHPVFSSHAIDPDAAAAMMRFDLATFTTRRTQAIAAAVDALASRLAEWERSDRPSIEYLLAQVGE